MYHTVIQLGQMVLNVVLDHPIKSGDDNGGCVGDDNRECVGDDNGGCVGDDNGGCVGEKY